MQYKSHILFLLLLMFSNFVLANSAYVQAIGGKCPPGGVYIPDYLGFLKCECTSYVAWRLNQDGVPFRNNWKVPRWGHAYLWENAAKRAGFSVDNSPRPGDIALWRKSGSRPYGHVAYVESVNRDGSVNITEYNRRGKHLYTARSARANAYIHVGGGGLSVKDLWRKADPIYTNSPFDAQFKLQNNSRRGVTVKAIAMAIHDSNNRFLSDMRLKYNVYIAAGRYYQMPITYVTAPSKAGTYQVVAKIKDDHGRWKELQSVKFTVRARSDGGSNNKASQYIDKCISKYSGYFGNKVGSKYSCRGNSLCQKTTGGRNGKVTNISIDKNLSGKKWYYYWGGWSPNGLALSNCN